MRTMLKQTILEATKADPAMLVEVIHEIKKEKSTDAKVEAVMEDVFNRYEDVFKALA